MGPGVVGLWGAAPHTSRLPRCASHFCRVVVDVGVDLGSRGLGADGGGAGLDGGNDTDPGRVGVC